MLMMPALAADEEITVAAQLHHVAGVDEAVGVDQRPAAERSTERDAVPGERMRSEPSTTFISTPRAAVKVRCGKSGQTIIDREGDAGLGGGVSMADVGLRKGRAQVVEDRLVGDFSGQADVAGAILPRSGDIKARRQCDGVPDRCVTPCRASRPR